MIHKGVRSFQARLLMLVALTSVLTSVFVGGSLVASNYLRMREEVVADLDAQADIIGLNAAAPLTFDDRPAASDLLEALRAKHHVGAAALYDLSQREFARMQQGGVTPPAFDPGLHGNVRVGSWLIVGKPVEHDHVRAGTLVVAYDLRGLQAGLLGDLLLSLLPALGASVVALVIGVRLQRYLSTPVAELVKTARQVTRTGDFSARATKHADDELGMFTDDFNGMLSEIERQARDLEKANQELRASHQLRVAKDSAEAASKAKSEFLAHMSHEIRTPLNGVMGMLDLLLHTELSEPQRRFGQLAKNAADSLTTVINDILDFSKIEAGKLEIVMADVNLHQTVEEVMELLAQKAAKKGLEMGCHIHPDVPPRVRADGDRLRQILINLINNAIKFTEQGAVVLRLTSERGADGQETVQFTVTDTGVGIAQDRIGRLFKSFSQADASTTRLYGGTGLGLAISKQLVELMGGTIGVESEPGRGSTFWFTLKLEGRSAGEAGVGTPSIDPRSLRVLAVDDSEVQRGILKDQITSWGLQAETAPDGEHAIELLTRAVGASKPFRVAIIDRDMPGMDAFDVAAAVKARSDISETVLMILLSVEDDIEPAKLRSMGFAGQMAKPVRQSQLFDAIMDAIASEQSEQALVPLDERPMQEGSKAKTPARGAGARILVAEDNEINQIVAQEILTRSGFQCEIVGDGKQAVEAVMAGGFDVVLMDCQMPVLDGFDATREIRRLEAERAALTGRSVHVPIIALTANAMKGDREQCLAAGMDAYASKPINPMELLKTIDDVFRGGSNLTQAA